MKLSHLVVAARVTKGYLPETMEARVQAIRTTIATLTHHSSELRQAMDARILAPYSFLSLLRPLIVIYSQLSALHFIPGRRPVGIAHRLQLALNNLIKGEHVILECLKKSFSVLPSWTAELDSSYDLLAKKAVTGVHKVYPVLNSLLAKQNMKTIYDARNLLRSSFIDPVINLVNGFEIRCMGEDLSRLKPLETLYAMSVHDAANEAGLHFIPWSIKFVSKQAIQEANFLVAANKRNRKLVRSLGLYVYSSCINVEYIFRALISPGINWLCDTFPGDRVTLDEMAENMKNAKAAEDARSRVNERWSKCITNLFDNSLRFTSDDISAVARFGNELCVTGDAFAAAHRQASIRRKTFVTRGSEYLG